MKDDIFETILSKFRFRQSELARECAVSRKAANRWFTSKFIPPKYWRTIVNKSGGEISINHLYDTFYPDKDEAA